MESINIVFNSMKVMFKKPIMFIYVAIMIAIFLSVDYFFKFSVLLSYASGMLKLESIILTLPIIINPVIFIPAIKFGLIGIVALSLIFSLFFSGLFNKLNSEKREKANFLTSIKKNYLLVAWTFMRAGLIIVVSTVALIFSAVPAIIVTNMAVLQGGAYTLIAIILDLLSIFILGTVNYFIKMYLVFWFPSTLNYKKPFKVSKTIVDKYFWKLLYNFIACDVIMIFGFTITIVSLARTENTFLSIIGTLIGAAIIDVIIVYFFSYVFTSFKRYIERLKQEHKAKNSLQEEVEG